MSDTDECKQFFLFRYAAERLEHVESSKERKHAAESVKIYQSIFWLLLNVLRPNFLGKLMKLNLDA